MTDMIRRAKDTVVNKIIYIFFRKKKRKKSFQRIFLYTLIYLASKQNEYFISITY